ncbi:ABC transporter ATP-binding protein [Nocardia brasiliensis]|uniref:ABC transporter ATP-binding protein n=1 Tax=Nocardia brasiliensis (strain ATCC 700358 / HUJEG-1) TaxID=1133849 RepID=K0EXC4_NOCB7|nr:ABC transporter ATP-binding protein [Nocardia brasiliensis]AFU01530.1 ABC transporter ATP-binding protein [Nocardia brasiliensis ATCC 700358]OCF85880.1 ABC transporter ATP-binding protein [Nocardia brasiliensis]
MSEVIQIADLRKTFGHVAALDGLDLTVREGEIHGFLGPNGAGKSTTIRVLLGILRATAGRAELLGRDPWADAVALHHELAYVPGDVTLWPSLSGGETIDLLARMRGGINAERREELIQRFDLDPRKKARTYSKGNRQKVALISALASDVRLLLLDEPTSGLDPLMEQVFRECVQEAKDRGTTVLLSSHILSEVEVLCDRVTIIRSGRTVESGTLSQMRHLSRTSITAELVGDPGDLDRLPGVGDIQWDGKTLRCQVDGEHLGELIRVLGDTGVRSLTSAPPTLEELFLRHYHVGADDSAADPAQSGEKVRA